MQPRPTAETRGPTLPSARVSMLSSGERQSTPPADLVAYWRNGSLCVDEFVRGRRIKVAPPVLQLLDRFGEPRSVPAAIQDLAGFELAPVRRAIRRLVRWGFLVPATDRKSRRDVSADWKGSFAAAHFHFATRNPIYLQEPGDQAQYLSRRFAAGPQPSLYRQYPRRPRVTLPADGRAGELTLDQALSRRRTVREFTRRPVALSDFARIVRGTWGQTGWLDGGILGQLIVKTSPSAGARHPIECYVLAWRVKGLTARPLSLQRSEGLPGAPARGRLSASWRCGWRAGRPGSGERRFSA